MQTTTYRYSYDTLVFIEYAAQIISALTSRSIRSPWQGTSGTTSLRRKIPCLDPRSKSSRDLGSKSKPSIRLDTENLRLKPPSVQRSTGYKQSNTTILGRIMCSSQTPARMRVQAQPITPPWRTVVVALSNCAVLFQRPLTGLFLSQARVQCCSAQQVEASLSQQADSQPMSEYRRSQTISRLSPTNAARQTSQQHGFLIKSFA